MLKSISGLQREQLDIEKTIKESWDSTKGLKFNQSGYLIEMDLGGSKKVWIDHIPTVLTEYDAAEDGNEERATTEKTVTAAYGIVCKKPVTYGRLINAAIHQEFSEEDGEIDAINRKRFTDPDDQDVAVHDEFVGWVKTGLRNIGYKNND